MMLPNRQFEFANGLIVPPRTVKLPSWQYHVVKHPLGVNRGARILGGDPEGWGDLTPPVVEPGWRSQILAEIAAIDVGGARCELPETRGKKVKKEQAEKYACFSCNDIVADRCRAATSGERPVGLRYEQTILGLLSDLTDGVAVHRLAFTQAVARSALTPEALAGVRVLTVGMGPNEKVVAQFKRGDGVFAEFYVYQDGKTAHWRTAYRARAGGNARLSFLWGFPPSLGTPLSENCVVSRQWWESHGQ